MCNKSKERLKGRKEKNDIHVRNISSDEKYRWKGDANDRALQMTERDREDERKVDESPTRIRFATLHGLAR